MVTHRDHGVNIMTVSLYDDFSSDPKNLYSIRYDVDYTKYDMVGDKPDHMLSLPEYEVKDGPDP